MQATVSSPTKSSSSISSSSESMSSFSSTGSLQLELRPHKQTNNKYSPACSTLNHRQNTNPITQSKSDLLFCDNNNLAFSLNCEETNNNNKSLLLNSSINNSTTANDYSLIKSENYPFPIYDNNDCFSNYEYCSYDSISTSTSSPSDLNMQQIDYFNFIENSNESIQTLSKSLRNKIENLFQSLADQSSNNLNSIIFDEIFISSLFNIFYASNYKVSNFRQIYSDLVQSHVVKNTFLVVAKLGHECFKLNLLLACEYLLEFALYRIDTSSLRLKMATFSTLSACYWRQSKYIESINCMNLELNLACFLNQSENGTNESYNSNRYRLYGNLASAYQRLNKLDECLSNFEHQLNLALEMNDNKLVINALNSMGLVYNKLKDYKKSLEYFEKSLELIENSALDYKILYELKSKQYNFIGEGYLKLSNYELAKEFLLKQIEISQEMLGQNQLIDNLEQHYLNLAITSLNLGFVYSKLKLYKESIEFYEKSLATLQKNLNLNTQNLRLKQQLLEIYGRLYIGLVNSNLQLKDNLHALLYAHSMLDFTLKEMVKLNNEQSKSDHWSKQKTEDVETIEKLEYFHEQRFKYLKYLEMSACSKLATCYAKQNRLNDAYKLYQRESALAIQLNNVLHLTRAYSHMAQINFLNKEYEQCIYLYKQILHSIEMSLLGRNNNNNNNRDQDNENNSETSSKDERLIQMIYFTLSNIGLCMEMLEKHDDALLMFQEQYEISKLLKNSKFRANALLNLVNLYLNKTKISENINKNLLDPREANTNNESNQNELIRLLEELNDVYLSLNDLNGQLFTSQCLAYSHHTSGRLKKAINFYELNIELANLLKQNDSLNKSLFNLSLCFKSLRKFQEAYKYQLDYFNQIDKTNPQNDYSRFISLGLIADLLFELEPSEENCQNCIQIHVDRLKLIKNSASLFETLEECSQNESKSVSNESKCKLIADCLESISKCYYQIEDFQQVLKFKLLQLELQNEIEATLSNPSNVNKQKCKLWLDIGNLFLFKFDDPNESYKYFEMVLEVSLDTGDLLLESLTLGNLGLCKQKIGDYLSALEFFKKQILVLEKKLKTIDEASFLNGPTRVLKLNQNLLSSSNFSTSSVTSSNETEHFDINSENCIKISNENIEKIKEIISIRIDMGRSYAKLGKCNELLSHNKINSQIYLNESIKYYNEYCRECEYLFEIYAKSYFCRLNEATSGSTDSDEEINFMMKELSEQIYIDYDTSLAKLASFNFTYKFLLEKSIELNEKRLAILLIISKYLLNRNFLKNLNVQINFMLANLYAKHESFLVKSLEHCENVIQIYIEDNQDKVLKDDLFLIETLNLYSDISVVKFPDRIDFDVILSKILDSYKLVWRHNKLNDSKILQLKYDTMCRLCALYRRSKMVKECLEVLMDTLNKFTQEFQKLHENNQGNEKNMIPKNFCLIQYIEYLFLIHRKIALIHMKHGMESNLLGKNKPILLLALKHVNESLMYLNYQKEFQSGHIIEFRQASIYFLFGKCHKYLKNSEMELEMFANSLDLYENIIPQNSYNKETCIKDRILSLEPKFHNHHSGDEIFDSFRHDYDDETLVNYLERIDHLYQYIEDVLIRMNKFKEALLVTERHRTKLCPDLINLPDLLNFEQVDKLIGEKNVQSVIYYSKIDISSTLNCWLLQTTSKNVANSSIMKFHQINFKSFDSLFLSKKGGSKAECSNFTDEIITCNYEDQNILLGHVYNVLLRPFETFLFDQEQTNKTSKPYLCIIFDESMLKLPFHLLKTSNQIMNEGDSGEKYLFELFELDCMYSLKYLFKTTSYNQRYTKHQNDYSFTIPMKVISNEEEMEKLLNIQTTSPNKSAQYQYDMLLLLVSSENKDVKSLNMLLNNLMSRRITKSILLEFNYENGKKLTENAKQDLELSEQNGKVYLKRLYSKMLNRTTLNSTLIFKTLINDKLDQNFLLNYLLFGNLGIHQIQNLLTNSQTEQSSSMTNSSPTRKPSLESNKLNRPIKFPDEQTTPPIVQDTKKENSNDNVLLELSQENNEVTFSQVVVQYLKLNSKLDKPTLVLDIIIFILNEYITGSLALSDSVSFISLYEKYSSMSIPNNIITASRLMLKRLGFSFYIDKDGKYMVKLPDRHLLKKLRLIQRCLIIFQNSNHTEYLAPMLYRKLKEYNKKQHQTNLKTKNTSLTLKLKTYKLNESFLREFTKIINQSEAENKIQLESETELFNNLILISTIILNDFMKNEAEKSLQDYIEIFFKQVDEDVNKQNKNIVLKSILEPVSSNETNNEDDLSSQYSTLSSILGIQPPPKVYDSSKDDVKEIKIHRELSKAKISKEEIDNAKMYASKLHKMIEVNVDTQSENPSVYDKYLSELLDNDLKNLQNFHKVTKTTMKTVHSETKSVKFNENNQMMHMSSSHRMDDEMFECEFKCKNLVKLEEKEYMDQIITTTTTVRTMKNDDLLMLFESNINDCDNQFIRNDTYENVNSQTDNNISLKSIKRANGSPNKNVNIPNQAYNNGNLNKKNSPIINLDIKNQINDKKESETKMPNIKKEVYNCLTNYTYEAK